ncbi:hypothetical protein N0V88_000889 [Collariella sp. IMI 366227]|nr:hypothetical protein N0V88_000889 [Collariella sp. IMI 366227]
MAAHLDNNDVGKKLVCLLFGDQSLDTHGFLTRFFRQENHGVLAKAFLGQVTHALLAAIGELPLDQRKIFPPFRNLQQLNERYAIQKVKHAGIDAALLCISQLAHYLDHIEKNFADVTPLDDTVLVGLCSGLWAAAAIATAPSLPDIVPAGVQAVLFALKLGSYVHGIGQRMSPTHERSESWTYLYSGLSQEDTEEKLASFHRDEGTPALNRAYVSAVSSATITVSGPPRTLKALNGSGVLSSTYPPSSLPVHGPYHAHHLHSAADVEKILGLNDQKVQDALYNTRPRFPVMSCGTAQWFQASDTKSLMASVASTVLNETLVFNKVLDTCVEYARQFEGKQCLVLPLGPTMNATTLSNLLKKETSLEVTLRQTFASSSSGTTTPRIGNQGSVQRPKLAIVGMAGRFPDAASHEKLWELLEKGLDVHREVPPDRFDWRTHVDSSGNGINKSHTPYGCWIEEPGLFDAQFFKMSRREVLQTDPMHRMALTTAYEALEMSGFVPNRTPSTKLDRVGTFYGQTSDDWREINAAQQVDMYFIPGGVRAFAPGRINYFMNFSGPSVSVDTACSSSAAALQVACTSLWAGDCDTAIVGGLNCMTNPDIFSGLSKGSFLSKKGPCATFDVQADGYCRGDGCASVIVKRLEDAVADHDRVLAVVLGTATNHSAGAISITHPHGPTQSELSTAILDDAGVDPLDVDYVEMHGTGTQAGDNIEMQSVTEVFAPAHRKRPADRPLYLGAVKANVGHGEAASGITALVKVLMMLEKNLIPPHVGIKAGSSMNPKFPSDLSERGVNIAFHTTPFKRKDGKPRRVFVNNFSAAGGNTGLLLEDAPKLPPTKGDPRTQHLVTVSAKSKASMIRNAKNLIQWMEKHPDTPLSHVAYTTTARRQQYHWRLNASGESLSEIQETIQKRLEDKFEPVASDPKGRPQVIMIFTGQGSHYSGLAKDFYRDHPVFRNSIDEFISLAKAHGFPSFFPLLDPAVDADTLPPIIIQLGIVCIEMAIVRLWASWGIKPVAVMGHSLGEYAALEAAGVFSASDAIFLVGSRASLLMAKCTANTHCMLAVRGKPDVAPNALEARGERIASVIEIACYNGHSETVFAGPLGKIEEMKTSLKAAGVHGTALRVPFAYHSAQVQHVLDEFEAIAEAVQYNTPRIPVISPLLSEVIDDNERCAFSIDANYLRRHMREVVNVTDALYAAEEAGVVADNSVWLEIGPHTVCTPMVKSIFGTSTVAVGSLSRKIETYKMLMSTFSALHLAGVDINFDEYHREFRDSVRMLDLPFYSFELTNYWIQYAGDWCIAKARMSNPALPREIAAPEPVSKLSTTTLQKIIREEVKGDEAVVEFESDLCQDQLRNIVSGHLVNGAPLCPSSLYGDMAMTACDYAYKLLRPDTKEKIGCNVANMEVPKTLIFNDKAKSHILRLTVKANAERREADLVFHTSQGEKVTEHAKCKVYYGKLEDWQNEFDRANYLVKSRIDGLQDAEKRGAASKVGRGLAYKLFSALVDYAPRYRGMEEVILDSATCEATARIRFQTSEQDGTFYFSPYHIDSVCHISGFIINGTDAVDSREQVYISHGWGSMRFTEIPQGNKEYRSYIRMQPLGATKMMIGDAYVFDGDKIIGITGDIKFQAIPRAFLNKLLPPRGTAVASAAPVAAAAASVVKKAASPKKAASSKKKETLTPATIGKVNQRLKTITSAIMDICAKEIGCSIDDLADNVAFADLGVDSILGIEIVSKVTEQMDMELSKEIFMEYATVSAFKKYLTQFEKPGRKDSISSRASDATCDDGSPDIDSDSNVTTPPEESETNSVKGDAEPAEFGSELQKSLRALIASEMQTEVDELIAAPSLADLGLDSIMGMTIVDRLLSNLNISVDSDFFLHHPTLKDVERGLGIVEEIKKPAARKQQSKQQAMQSTPSTSGKHPRIGLEEPAPPRPPRPSSIVDNYPNRKATSVVMSGRPKHTTKRLFLVPDGSGNSASYSRIAKIGEDWTVYGFFSPFMRTPEEYKCGVYGMASKFIAEMKQRQPEGPYNLAGWSAGGVIAYEMVYQLIQAGDEVATLILIDSPCPSTIEPLPQGLHAWFASIGLLGDGNTTKIPEWLLPHFAASVTALSNYTPEPVPKDKCPQVLAIWCEDGVCKLPTDPRPEPYPKGHALFLLDNRSDFGPNQWDELVDVEKMTFRHMPGNHFSMMLGDYADQLRGFVQEALGAQKE